MDLKYFQQALAEYQAKSGDTRPTHQLPAVVLMAVLQRAQELKDAGKLNGTA